MEQAQGSVLSSLVDIIFPPVCPLCEVALRKEEFCSACTQRFASLRITGTVCTVCGIPFASGAGPEHTCARCIRSPMPFTRARSAFVYDSAVLEALHAFKYDGRMALAAPLGRMAASAAPAGEPPEIVVPVPLHRKRLAERGFNQSLLMARRVAEDLGARLDYSNLARTRETLSQVGLREKERRKNVKGAFALRDPSVFSGRTVLLVDDVLTTGATMEECAGVLEEAGARVSAVTLARAVRI